MAGRPSDIRVDWRTVFGLPQGLLFIAGLALLVAGIAMTAGLNPLDWDSFRRLTFAVSLIIAASAFVVCSNVVGHLRQRERPMTTGRVIAGRLLLFTLLALALVMVALAAVAATELVTASESATASPVGPWTSLNLIGLCLNIPLLLGNAFIIVVLPPPPRAVAARAE